MTQEAKPHRSETDLKSDAAVLNMWLTREQEPDGMGEWKIDRCVISAGEYVNTISMRSQKFLAGFVVPEFAQALLDYLPRDERPHVMTSPDFAFETHGLTLHSLSITGQRAVYGVQSVLVTFRRVLGSITKLFLPVAQVCLLKEAQTGLSARVLEEIVTSALSLVEFAPRNPSQNNEERIAKCIERLEQNKHDLEFYATLIARFVHRMDDANHVRSSATEIGDRNIQALFNPKAA